MHNYSKPLLKQLLSFGLGTILGDVFLHMFPHLVHKSDNNGHSAHSHDFKQLIPPLMIILGINFLITLDFIIFKINENNKYQKLQKVNDEQVKDEPKEKHNHKHQEIHSGIPFLFCDFMHNLTNGIAVGTAFATSTSLGITTTLVILIHEIPHQIADFGHLISYEYNIKQIIKSQLFTCLIGGLLGGYLGLYYCNLYRHQLLCITAGGFLYMCMTNLLPEIKQNLKHNSYLGNFLLTIFSCSLGVLCMYGVTLIE
ncbi:zinc transporter, putative [Ichthyophthirius multifiliis]|uniref:Zinc transporter, putative n=1 Tax=Ichthyophthirius multifiliis TaxID=5932 RepID=G0QKG8_ICHMU|nr:zinc transporter, putative [Ichthyophthirius multifiliis]EGR34289.1 zinc transporter, putative [Ichthyophthirius multifiliis]|eukprot:XP_004039593.1 zinc transporter, putative [Ichthyophthirius multifiliis]